MAGLSSELYRRCREVLIQCDEFSDHASLRAVFVTSELIVFRDGLPTSPNQRELVSRTIDFLLPRRLNDGRHVFPILLANLRGRYEGTDLHDEIEVIRLRVEEELNTVEIIEIPYVTVAMNKDEADSLAQEDVFDDPIVAPIERSIFQEFRESLQENGIDDWLSNYKETRDEWQPRIFPYDETKSVGVIVSDISIRLNHERKNLLYRPHINLQSYSVDFFSQDSEVRITTWDKLRTTGCVLLLDAISMFHPNIHQTLLQSAISSSGRVAILVLSPVSFNEIKTNQLIEGRIDSQIQLAFSRIDKYLDMLCEVGTGDSRSLKRWLFAVLPEVEKFILEQSPNASSIKAFRTTTQEPPRMDQLIFRRREKK